MHGTKSFYLVAAISFPGLQQNTTVLIEHTQWHSNNKQSRSKSRRLTPESEREARWYLLPG